MTFSWFSEGISPRATQESGEGRFSPRIERRFGWRRSFRNQNCRQPQTRSIMKRSYKPLLAAQLAALFLLPTLAATADVTVPFKGVVGAQESYQFDFENDPPLMFVDTAGSGNATHLGRFTVQWEFTVDLVTLEGLGTARFVGANQDELLTEAVGLGIPTDITDVFVVVEDHTITGGSGRFEGATGSFRVERLVNTATGVTAGSFSGTLVRQ